MNRDLLKFKVWLLNLKRIDESNELEECRELHAIWKEKIAPYEFYKVFNNNPEHHMLYTYHYLTSTSVFKLLWKYYQYQSFFRRMHVNERW